MTVLLNLFFFLTRTLIFTGHLDSFLNVGHFWWLMCILDETRPVLRSKLACLCTQDNQMSIAEDERRKDEELDRQALLAEQRREEERLLQEEQQRERMVKIKAVEGKINDLSRVLNTNMLIFLVCCHWRTEAALLDQFRKNSISSFFTLSLRDGTSSDICGCDEHPYAQVFTALIWPSKAQNLVITLEIAGWMYNAQAL